MQHVFKCVLVCALIKIMNENTNYRDKRSVRDQRYRLAFAEHMKSLSPKQRAAYAQRGIAGAHTDTQGAGAPELDTNRLADHSYIHDFEFDKPEHEQGLSESEIIQQLALKAIRGFLVEIVESVNARFTVECLALITGVFYLGTDEAAIAKKFKVSRAKVSKRCLELKGKAEALTDDKIVIAMAFGAMRKFLVEIIESKNARLSGECLALVTGIAYLGISETTISEKFHISRSAVSKRCVELCQKLGLPPSRSMKSEEARKTYRRSRHRAHANN